jgi:hypothetical protein
MGTKNAYNYFHFRSLSDCEGGGGERGRERERERERACRHKCLSPSTPKRLSLVSGEKTETDRVQHTFKSPIEKHK